MAMVSSIPGGAAALSDDLSTGPFRTAEAEPMAIEDIRDALVVRENGIFLLTDKQGNVPAGNESGFGLYFQDCRYLSTYEFSCTSAPLVMLLSTAAMGYASEHVLTNPRMVTLDGREIPRETIEVRRQRHVDGGLRETVRVTNFNLEPVTLEFRFSFGADFADIFEVRGQERVARGQRLPPRVNGTRIEFRYASLDGIEQRTIADCDEMVSAIDAESATFRLRLGPREAQQLRVSISIGSGGQIREAAPADDATERRRTAASYARWREGCTRVLTSNEIFNTVLERSINDVRTLWNADERGGYLVAGSPWFDTLFGRDSIITSLEMLAFRPALAKSTLMALAELQGKVVDDWRDEQPGKILHETRAGEMARTGEVAFSRYYGSVDATALFMLLAAEYWRWTADRRLLRMLEPNLIACLDWVRRWGDADGDGFVEYERAMEKGLLNQGWKDSGDAIVHADGRLAAPPIALVEVQGYLFAGLLGLSEVAQALRNRALADDALREARSLRARFNRSYWMEDRQFYALALDGSKQQVRSIASNPGHCLFTLIAPARRGAAVARRLMEPDMFSGWGIRTLSADSNRFNPMGYHVGSIWPHDNALIAAGMKRYGQESLLEELATAIYDTARAMEYYRLPELFCGSPRTSQSQPVPYPVACRPQAWAAGAIPLVVTALLGLCPRADRGELSIVRPRLPGWLDRVEVRQLHVGKGSADLLFELRNRRTQVTVLQTTGGLGVTVVPRWPLPAGA
jgi:glycogen debranching enzyme